MHTSPNASASLQTWIDWLLNLHAQEIDLGLARISQVAQKMKVLRPAPLVITVAGTNGKGSSVAMLFAILKAAGYRVGAYTSPHIHQFNERFNVDGTLASDEQITQVFAEIEQARDDIKLTYFEFSTLAALRLFQQAQLDVVVLEVGLGGRLDAVNIVDADAALVTAIDVDHIDWLGDDRNQIALEKAGIMRSGQIAVCSDSDIPQTLLDFSANLKVDLRCLGADFSYQAIADGWQFVQGEAELNLEKPALPGAFQLQNASGVVALLLGLQASGRIAVPVDSFNQGLQSVVHAGRLQWLSYALLGQEQRWLFDVAHNPQSAQVLSSYFEESSLSGFATVFSVLEDKDAEPMLRALQPYIEQWHIADLQIPRAMGVEKIRQLLQNLGVEPATIFSYDSVAQAAQGLAQRQHERPMVWGSFFTVAQAQQGLNALVEGD